MPAYTYPQYKADRPYVGTFHSYWLPGNPVDGTYRNYTNREYGVEYSTGHKRAPDGKYRTGGPWISNKRQVSTFGDYSTTYVGNGVAYKGCYLISNSADTDWSNLTTDPSSEYSNERLNSYGAQAYQALRPDIPDFSPMVALGELLGETPGLLSRVKDFRSAWKREIRRKQAKEKCILNKAGRWHLAIQFGWLPIMSDLLKFASAYQGANKRYAQLIRDEGRWIRRSRVLEKVGHDKDEFVNTTYTTYTSVNHPSIVPVHVTGAYGPTRPTGQSSEHQSVFVWCEGKTKYYLPNGLRDDKWVKRLKRRIYADMTLSPDVVYQLIPFTWLIDYFISLGSIISYLSDNGLADKVIFDYGYVMRKVEKVYRFRATQSVKCGTGQSYQQVSATRERRTLLQTRGEANRFGWGFSEADLTPYQWGILGALGASKL